MLIVQDCCLSLVYSYHRRYLPIYTGRPNLTDTSYYGIQMAWKNSSTGQNFIDGCVNANVSSVSVPFGVSFSAEDDRQCPCRILNIHTLPPLTCSCSRTNAI